MIETKVFELRDSGTFIPVIASCMHTDEPEEQWLLRRAGYAPHLPHLILLTRLDGGQASYDPYDWGGRTYPSAHHYIQNEWERLRSGDLIDVRVILGEAKEPCESERLL